jgi:hypothetical protein
MSELYWEERGRRRDRARKRAKETKAYKRAMRPWWQRNIGPLILILIVVAFLYIHSL